MTTDDSDLQNLPQPAFADSTDEGDYGMAVRLTRELGVVSILVSVFYSRKTIPKCCASVLPKMTKRCSAPVSGLPGGV